MTFRLLGLDDIDPHWADGPIPRWRLGAALGTPGGMTLPVQEIFVHHTVSADTGDVVKDVAGPCNTDQANFGKLSYSWNIHRSTMSVIEIEGTHRGAHTVDGHNNSLNDISFGFGVIGNYHSAEQSPKPTTPDDTLIELIAEAIVDRAIKPGYALPNVPIKGHRDSGFATACCGDLLYARLPDIRTAVARLVTGAPWPAPTAFAPTGQGGPMITLDHPNQIRADDFWVGPDRAVHHRFFVYDPATGKGEWSQEENLGGIVASVSAAWMHDASQLRLVVAGSSDGGATFTAPYEKVYDGATNKWRDWNPLPGVIHP